MAATEVKVPDIGDFKDIPVIELLVKPGDTVKKDDSLLVLESDKATMEVPAPCRGRGGRAEGQGRRQGERRDAAGAARGQRRAPAVTNGERRRRRPRRRPRRRRRRPAPAPASARAAAGARGAAPRAAPPRRRPRRRQAPIAHASPGVRRFARELGVPLGQVTGSGPKGRILKEDIQAFVKQALSTRRRRRARRRARRSGSAALAQGGLRQVRPDRDAGRARASRRSRRPGWRATG